MGTPGVADPQANPAIRRGMNLMVMDGPGQGISNLRKIRVTPDNYDYLLTRPEVDPERFAIAGVSMGSFWGMRIAANDSRVRALATAASCFGTKTAIFEEASPRFKRVFMYMAGIHDEDEFDEKVAAHLTTTGYGEKIACPTLLIQGEYDPLCPLEDAQQLFEELRVPKEMWILEDDFHGIWRLPGLGSMDVFPFIMDWLKDVLEKGPPTDARVKWVAPKTGPGPYDDSGCQPSHRFVDRYARISQRLWLLILARPPTIFAPESRKCVHKRCIGFETG